MAYHGYIDFISKFAGSFSNPTILEIGVDKGQTLFPVTNYLTKVCNSSERRFLYTGVDVLLRDHVKIASHHINAENWRNEVKNGFIQLYEENSLSVLPRIASDGFKYSTVLVDGDHNYKTVSEELKFAQALVSEEGIIICDDYDGEGGSQDEYFSEQDGNFYDESEINENIQNLMTRGSVDCGQKVGVKGAVDEFLENNPEWDTYKFYTGEPPIILYRKDTMNIFTHIENGSSRIGWKFLG